MTSVSSAAFHSPSHVRTTHLSASVRVPNVARLEAKLEEKDRRVAKLKAENRILQQLIRTKDSAIQEFTILVEQEKETTFKRGPRGDLVQGLKHEITVKEQECSRLREEVKQFTRDLTDRESELLKLSHEVAALKSARENEEVDNRHLHAHCRVLIDQINELQGENKTLLRIQRIKTWAIEKLTRQLDPRGGREDEVTHLQNEVAWRDKDIAHFRQELASLNRVLEDSHRKEQELLVRVDDDERQLFALEQKTLRKESEDRAKRIKSQKKEIADLHMEVQRLKGQNYKLELKLKNANSQDSEKNKLENEKRHLEEELKEKMRIIERHLEQIARYERELSQLTNARQREEEHQRARVMLQSEIEVLRNMIAKKEQEIKKS